MSVTQWTLPGVDDQPIYGNTHCPDGTPPVGVLVISHGFKGYKDYGFFPYLARAAAKRGLVAHRFNFSQWSHAPQPCQPPARDATRDETQDEMLALFSVDMYVYIVYDSRELALGCDNTDRDYEEAG